MWNPAPSETLEEQIDFFSWLYDKHKGFLSQDDRRYFWGKGISKSGLDGLRKSMDHYFKAHFKESDEMNLGLAFHCRILEPSKYDDRFLYYHKLDGRTEEGKKQAKRIEKRKEELRKKNKYQKILKMDDHETVLGMEEALWNHPEAGPLFRDGGISEETVVWNNEKHGTLMKGKLDFRIPHEKVIIDLKTSSSAHIDDVTHT